MKYNKQKHNRKSIRLKEYDYSFPGWYYVTICTFERQHLFGNIENGKMILNDKGKIVEEEWIRTKEIRKNIDLDYYVTMPNHFHGIIIIEQSVENVTTNRRGELNSPATNKTGHIQYALQM
jgi:REP element-mobilizing transposase RayT